jgi:excinuclease UvrABC nuclease subunit
MRRVILRNTITIILAVILAAYAMPEEIKVSKKINKALKSGKPLKPRQIKKLSAKIKQTAHKHRATKNTSKIAHRGLNRCAKALKVVKHTKTIAKAVLGKIPGIGVVISLAMPDKISASTLEGVGKGVSSGGCTP